MVGGGGGCLGFMMRVFLMVVMCKLWCVSDNFVCFDRYGLNDEIEERRC